MKLKNKINNYTSWEHREYLEKERERLRGQQKILGDFEDEKI